jgi:hypothetical protein
VFAGATRNQGDDSVTDKLFTIEALATLAGASYLVFLVVSYTKQYVKLPTAIYAVMVSFAVLLPAQIGTGAPINDWKVYFLSLANAFLVASLAGKANDEAVRQAPKE